MYQNSANAKSPFLNPSANDEIATASEFQNKFSRHFLFCLSTKFLPKTFKRIKVENVYWKSIQTWNWEWKQDPGGPDRWIGMFLKLMWVAKMLFFYIIV